MQSASRAHDRIVPGDGLGPLIHVTSWALLRAIDAQIHICGDTGSLTIKVRKGRVAGFTATQETLWAAAEAA